MDENQKRDSINRAAIVENWLPRYTGMPIKEFGTLILLTNFYNYVERFSERFNSKIFGIGGPMQASTNNEGITIVNLGIGSPNAATIMDLLSAIKPDAVLFLGKCGGLKSSVHVGDFILPMVAIGAKGQDSIIILLRFLLFLLLDYIVLWQKKLLRGRGITEQELFIQLIDEYGSGMRILGII